MASRSWKDYPATYRAREIKIIAGWISSGESGSVVGLPGVGRSNLLGFLCYRPEIFQSYLLPQVGSVVFIPVDINNLAANNLSTLYRVILRSFYRVRDQFSQALQEKVIRLYQESRTDQDAFLSQSALQELLLDFQTQQALVVLLLNRFDRFCQVATPQMVNTLRGLRDDFKATLCYIAGMTQEVAYLPDPTVLDQMYELLDQYVCWLGAMNDEDACNLIARATYAAPVPPTETDVSTMLALTGGYPALLRTACHWWLTEEHKPLYSKWGVALLGERSVQHRLAKIWAGLTQEEQFILSELQQLQTTTSQTSVSNQSESSNQNLQEFTKQYINILTGLAEKGVCRSAEAGWQIAGELLATYIAEIAGRGRGRIWLDEPTGQLYQGQTSLTDLTTLERSVLAFLIKHPYVRHPKTDLIINTWPDDLRRQGVTDNSLYQVIFTIRQVIETNPNKPVYLVTWRGKPEGGYQFFPEGRPA